MAGSTDRITEREVVVPESDSDVLDQLQGLGFSSTIRVPPRRLIISVSGKDGTGKTHFALTGPEPVILFNIDMGTEGVVSKFQLGLDGQKAKRVLVYDVRVPKGADKEVYESIWQQVRERAEVAYRLKQGTVVWDTDTENYELCRLARFGRLTQIMPHHYSVVNNDYREFLRLAYLSGVTTVLIHKVKPVYVNGNRTTDYEESGMSEIPFMVQLRLRTFRNDPASPGEMPEFGCTVLKCRPKPSMMGQTISGPMFSIPFFLSAIHGPAKKTQSAALPAGVDEGVEE